MTQNQKKSITDILLRKLWAVWAVSGGALALVLVFAMFIPKVWLPLVVFVIGYALSLIANYMKHGVLSRCTAIVRVVKLTMYWTALIMLAINTTRMFYSLDNFFVWSPTNPDIPFITCLILFPVLTILSVYVMVRGYSSPIFQIAEDTVTGNGVMASISESETRYQVQLLLIIGVCMSAVDWWYFFTYYYNVNMNTPDRFFFNYMPIGMYLISLFFVWSRYRNMGFVLGPVTMNPHELGLEVRYLVLFDGQLLLQVNEFERWDTPAITYIDTIYKENHDLIASTFGNISGLENYEVKRLYVTPGVTAESTVEHYAVFVNSNHIPEHWLGSEWFSIGQIDSLIKHAEAAPDLADEIYRIYTITMAWKTYDREGHRRYPIKQYRPSFRLSDLKDWTVDYGDLRWLRVAQINQDKPFYKARRFFSKLFSGR
ncbi:MAG: hypothetical protein K2M19_02200 [Muribaculaceae bacterium]|nr:hypothetical protein [Muribaculaceae bacterium]